MIPDTTGKHQKNPLSTKFINGIRGTCALVDKTCWNIESITFDLMHFDLKYCLSFIQHFGHTNKIKMMTEKIKP